MLESGNVGSPVRSPACQTKISAPSVMAQTDTLACSMPSAVTAPMVRTRNTNVDMR